ncbi:hypothetical protein FNO01nite_17350 [Flavobacterium noncentrifugens]|uniref:Polyisoprenoid-binding protein YceI n=1 Tax=Flavobacterium noncentrifugens TaxID=1128970 RepID=A0A1G8WUN1_9FLAO|nr:YceI family protein [Flavobacterium noncentrifugens]GEP51063.1 hypothetical protein FNO01nite_17350 [Flavobacterium noncentrifugens]SDJ82099.1 Polyisoprenoid-binding protein YceI [Flavobacterium noncentrifugens]
MKYKNTSGLLIASILFLSIINNITAQANFKIEDSRDNAMKLSGTSTFHDWTMQTGTFSGNAQFGLEPGNYITALRSLEFSLPVLTLKSGEKKLDKNAYKALKTKQFKDILYKLTSAKVTAEKDYKYQIKTTGNLTVAGVTKEVVIDIFCMANKNGSITCEGNYKINMGDYNVQAPNFMGGLMTTGEGVTLDFSMRFER